MQMNKHNNKLQPIAKKRRRMSQVVSMRTGTNNMSIKAVFFIFILFFCQISHAANATGLGFGVAGTIFLLVITAVVVLFNYLILPAICIYICYWLLKKTRFHSILISYISSCLAKKPALKSTLVSIKEHKYRYSVAAFLLWIICLYLVTNGFSELQLDGVRKQ